MKEIEYNKDLGGFNKKGSDWDNPIKGVDGLDIVSWDIQG